MRYVVTEHNLRPARLPLEAHGGRLCVAYPPGDCKVYVRKAIFQAGWSARFSKGHQVWYGYGATISDAVQSLCRNYESVNAWLHAWDDCNVQPQKQPTKLHRFLNWLLRL